MEGGSVALVDHTPPSLTPHRCRRLALVSLLELGPRRSYAFALFRRPRPAQPEPEPEPASESNVTQTEQADGSTLPGHLGRGSATSAPPSLSHDDQRPRRRGAQKDLHPTAEGVKLAWLPKRW